MPLDQAIAIIRAESGKSFDPKIVEILERRYVEMDKLARESHRIAKLPTDVKVERGDAPAAGFEKTAEDLANIDGAIRQTNALADLAAAISGASDRDALVRALHASLGGVVAYDAMALYIRRGETLAAEYAEGEHFHLFASAPIPLGAGLSGWVAENGKAIVNGNPSVEPGFLTDPARFGALGSALSIPLIGPRGIAGVLSLYRKGHDAFRNEHLASLNSLSSALANALELGERRVA
jgi:GAF domain-containing protein